MTPDRRAYYVVWLLLVVTLGGATGYVVGHRTGNTLLGILGMLASITVSIGLFVLSRRPPPVPKAGPE